MRRNKESIICGLLLGFLTVDWITWCTNAEADRLFNNRRENLRTYVRLTIVFTLANRYHAEHNCRRLTHLARSLLSANWATRTRRGKYAGADSTYFPAHLKLSSHYKTVRLYTASTYWHWERAFSFYSTLSFMVSCLRLFKNKFCTRCYENFQTALFSNIAHRHWVFVAHSFETAQCSYLQGSVGSVTEYSLSRVSTPCSDLIFKGQWISVMQCGIDIIRGYPSFVVISSLP
jgi:hypothetical protein